MKFRTALIVIVVTTLLASALTHLCFSGAYVLATKTDRHTFWIGPVSTTIPFAFWALVTIFVASMRRGHRRHLLATLCGYVAGWVAMSVFTLWILSLPRGPEHSSTMAIAVLLTPFMFMPIFPIPFLLGFLTIPRLWHSNDQTQTNRQFILPK